MRLYLVPIREQRLRVDRKHAIELVCKVHGKAEVCYYGAERWADLAVLAGCRRRYWAPGLRAFNLGRHVRRKPHQIQRALEALAAKCAEKNDWTIPISGGDSWRSYAVRLGNAVLKIVNDLSHPDAVLLLDPRAISTLKHMQAKNYNAAEFDARAALLTPIDDGKIYLLKTIENVKKEEPVAVPA